MAKNIEININTNGTTYEVLYPKTLGTLVSGAVASANKLTTERTILTNLGTTTAGSFDGTSNVKIGVTGTLPVARGGTGTTSLSSLASSLKSYLGGGNIDVCLIKTTKYMPTGSGSVTIKFSDAGVSNGNQLQAVYIIPADVQDTKGAYEWQRGNGLWITKACSWCKIDKNGYFSVDAKWSSYQVVLGSGEVGQAEYTQGLFNYNSFGDSNYCIGFFGRVG